MGSNWMYGGNNMLYPQQQTNTVGVSPNFKIRPVSSVEEANAAQIDYDGSLFIFPNIGQKEFYTKQLLPDGSVDFQVYQAVNRTPPQVNKVEYVTEEKFAQTMENLKRDLANKFNALERGKGEF